MKSINGIRIPEKVRKDDEVKAEDFNALVDAIQAAIKLANSAQIYQSPDIGIRSNFGGQTLYLKRRAAAAAGLELPFWPTLITIPAEGEGDPSYKVSVSDGWVNERIPGVNAPPTNATPLHKPWNLLWGEDAEAPALATDRRTFDIAIGQQISVLVNVAPEGFIEKPEDAPPESLGPTEIAIEAEDEKSIYWVPPCADDDEGSAGVFHYKMAVFRAADSLHPSPWLEYFLAGSHLDHYGFFLLDNAANPAPSGSGRVLKEYKKDANQFIFRLIQQAGALKVTENESGIEIRGNENTKYTEWKDEGASEGIKLEFDDGLRATGENQTVLLPVVVAGEGISVGISPGTTKTYVVSKNPSDGWTGDALLRDCDGDPGGDPPTDGSIIFRLSIENGQIVAVNASELERPLHENVEIKHVQSCCWIDDIPHSHEV